MKLIYFEILIFITLGTLTILGYINTAGIGVKLDSLEERLLYGGLLYFMASFNLIYVIYKKKHKKI